MPVCVWIGRYGAPPQILLKEGTDSVIHKLFIIVG